MGYHSLFTFRALPGIRSDGFGSYEQPEILFIRFTSQAMPTSLQIVGRPYDDEVVFRVAAGYESAAEPLFTEGRFPDFRGS